MLISPSRVPDTRTRRLAAIFYAYSFLDDLVLLYPVYALLFTDTGLSVVEISSLFVIWSLTGILLEVPSGVWADVISRRLLLAAAPLLGAAGFGLWVAAPSYWAFAVGFVLWGARSALQSGAAEALVYEELDRLGAADRYASVMGRASAFGLVAVMLATGTAGPVFAVGGYPLVGAASVLASLLCAAVGLLLPEHRDDGVPGHRDDGVPGHRDDRMPDEEPGQAGYLATLRAGLAEARTDPSLRRALLFVPAMAAVWGALEEYSPLLAGNIVSAPVVPLLLLLVWAGVTAGGLLAGVGKRLPPRTFAVTLGLAALALAAGALSHRPAGFVLLAGAFCVFQMATLVADARLQERITGSSRATVTSLAGLGTELATIAVFGGYAVASAFTGHSVIFALFAVPYLLIAFGLGRAARPVPIR